VWQADRSARQLSLIVCGSRRYPLPLKIRARTRRAVTRRGIPFIEVRLIKLLESGLTACTTYTNVIKITVPQNGGHSVRRAAIGRMNTPLNTTAKRSFYRAANGIFAKIGRLASEKVMVQLLKQKCLPILLYALDVCNLDKISMQSLDFTFNRFFMKLFKTSNMEIVNWCQRLFGCDLPSTLVKQRFEKFIATL